MIEQRTIDASLRATEPIAGIKPIVIEGHPLDYLYASQSNITAITNRFERSLTRSRSMPELLTGGLYAETPAQKFLITSSLFHDIKQAASALTSDLSQHELTLLGLANQENAVFPYFSSQAINQLNTVYFSSTGAFTEFGMADMFINNKALHQAVGRLIVSHIQKPEIRIQELCSGEDITHALNLAKTIHQESPGRSLQIRLTDFVSRQSPSNLTVPSYVTLSTGEIDLLNKLPQLSPKQKVDVMMMTYGFDSIFSPEDMYIERRGNNYYQALYRIKIAEWHPRQEELLFALQSGTPLNNPQSSDYQGIFIERAFVDIDLTEHPFGNYIKERMVSRNLVKLNFPGGLLRVVLDAFSSQITEDGIFIIGDTASYLEDSAQNTNPYETTGIAAKYKVEDYFIAAKILKEKYNLNVNLMSLNDLVQQYGGYSLQRSESMETNYELSQINSASTKRLNCVMVITK